MKIDQFKNDIDKILSNKNNKKSFKEENTRLNEELLSYLKINLHLLNNDDLLYFLKEKDNSENLMIIGFVSKESTKMIWDYAKSKNNNMINLYEESSLFNAPFNSTSNREILSELIDLDVNVLVKNKNHNHTLLVNILSSDSEIDFLLKKKDLINNADESFKKEFLKYLSSITAYFSKENKKETLTKLIVNVDGWNDIDENALRNLLYMISRFDKNKKNKCLSIISSSFNTDFFKKGNTDMSNLLLFAECVPTKKFIKTCSKYQDINNEEWFNIIEFSDALHDDKIYQETKIKKLCSNADNISDDVFFKMISFYSIGKEIDKNDGLEDFLYQYKNIQAEKKEIEKIIDEQKLKDEQEINKKRL